MVVPIVAVTSGLFVVAEVIEPVMVENVEAVLVELVVAVI